MVNPFLTYIQSKNEDKTNECNPFQINVPKIDKNDPHLYEESKMTESDKKRGIE